MLREALSVRDYSPAFVDRGRASRADKAQQQRAGWHAKFIRPPEHLITKRDLAT